MKKAKAIKIVAAFAAFMALSQCLDGDMDMWNDSFFNYGTQGTATSTNTYVAKPSLDDFSFSTI